MKRQRSSAPLHKPCPGPRAVRYGTFVGVEGAPAGCFCGSWEACPLCDEFHVRVELCSRCAAERGPVHAAPPVFG